MAWSVSRLMGVLDVFLSCNRVDGVRSHWGGKIVRISNALVGTFQEYDLEALNDTFDLLQGSLEAQLFF